MFDVCTVCTDVLISCILTYFFKNATVLLFFPCFYQKNSKLVPIRSNFMGTELYGRIQMPARLDNQAARWMAAASHTECRGRLVVDPSRSAKFPVSFNSVPSGFGRLIAAPTAAAAKPPTGRLLVDPYRACARRFLSGKEPGGSGNQRIGTGFAASLSGGTAAYTIISILYFFSQQSICSI